MDLHDVRDVNQGFAGAAVLHPPRFTGRKVETAYPAVGMDQHGDAPIIDGDQLGCEVDGTHRAPSD
jgi:hypothetical protein